MNRHRCQWAETNANRMLAEIFNLIVSRQINRNYTPLTVSSLQQHRTWTTSHWLHFCRILDHNITPQTTVLSQQHLSPYPHDKRLTVMYPLDGMELENSWDWLVCVSFVKSTRIQVVLLCDGLMGLCILLGLFAHLIEQMEARDRICTLLALFLSSDRPLG